MGVGREGARQNIVGIRKSWQTVYWPITEGGCGRGREGKAREGEKKGKNLVTVNCDCFLLLFAHLCQKSGEKFVTDENSS